DEHVLAAIGREVRAAARGRETIIVAENEPQETHLVRPVERGGYGLDGLGNDDLHHAAMVALTGNGEGYYTDYRGSPQELISAVKRGYLYQGQRYKWQRTRRGTPALDLPASAFVTFIENHDQIANSAHGLRLHQLTSPGRYRAMTAFLLLSPPVPMLFQGQEFASSAPFLYFADHRGELGNQVRKGRAAFLAQFPSIASPQMMTTLSDPSDAGTFERCKLDFAERGRHESIYAMHRDLIRLRRRDPVFRAQRPHGVDGAVLGPEAFVLRFFGEESLQGGNGAAPPLPRDPRDAPHPLPPPGAPACPARRHALARPVVERRHGLWRAGHRSPRDAIQLAHSRPRRRRSRAHARGPGGRSGARRGGGDGGSRVAPGGAPARGDRLVPVPLRSLTIAGESVREAAVAREWLVTNGLGGFAAGTVAGVPPRRYHGLLVAALPTPLGRTLMLNHLSELLRLSDGTRFEIGG